MTVIERFPCEGLQELLVEVLASEDLELLQELRATRTPTAGQQQRLGGGSLGNLSGWGTTTSRRHGRFGSNNCCKPSTSRGHCIVIGMLRITDRTSEFTGGTNGG